jgi:hypothetical protein
MIPRATTARDTYLDFAIPEATTLFVNTYAMHFDEVYFPFPGEFRPQRFLEEGHVLFEEKYRGRKKFPGRRERHGAFGWGRRSCPGAELGKSCLFIVFFFLLEAAQIPVWFFRLFCLTRLVYFIRKRLSKSRIVRECYRRKEMLILRFWAAVNVISILLAKVVWGFELLRVEGEELEGIEYEGGAIQKPGAFGCVFKVRSEAHREVIEREGKWAEEVLGEFEAW